VAKFNHNPGVQHWKAVKRIFRFLAGTREYEIFFSPNPSGKEEEIVGFSNADHAGDPDITIEYLHPDVSSSATEDLFLGSVGNKVAHPCQRLKLSL
jgi:hypothetical protein